MGVSHSAAMRYALGALCSWGDFVERSRALGRKHELLPLASFFIILFLFSKQNTSKNKNDNTVTKTKSIKNKNSPCIFK